LILVLQCLLTVALASVAASLLYFARKLQLSLRRTDELQSNLAHALKILSGRVAEAESLAQTLSRENGALQKQAAEIFTSNRAGEVDFLRDELRMAHRSLMALTNRGALAQVLRPSGPVSIPDPDALTPSDASFRSYPTDESPIDTISPPSEHRPRHPRETEVLRPVSSDDPNGYDDSVVPDHEIERLLFT
jgi:hypothetical protein